MSKTVSRVLTSAGRIKRARTYAVPQSVDPSRIKLWLDANEGVAPPLALLRMSAARVRELSRRYPSARELERILARRHGVAEDRVIVTAGIDDALHRACMVMLEVGRNMVLTTPTFEMYPRYAQLAGGEIRETPWWEGPYPVEDVLQLANSKTALIAFVSPNNPTGAAASASDLECLSRGCPRALILADFAYAEFADEDLMPAALQLPNVLTCRTFSKAWGLAGLRIGYAVGPPQVIAWLRAAGNPYAISGPSLAIAGAALRSGQKYVEQSVTRVRAQRDALFAALQCGGAHPFRSQANFVFAKFRNALAVWRGLAARGTSVRAFPGRRALEQYLRITCPGDSRFDRLLDALRKVLPQAERRSRR